LTIVKILCFIDITISKPNSLFRSSCGPANGAHPTISLLNKIEDLKNDLENLIKSRNNTNKKEDDTNLIEKKEPSNESSYFSFLEIPTKMIDLDEVDIKYIKNAQSSQEMELKEINTELENLEKNVLFQINNFDSEKIEDQKQAHKKFKEYWSNLYDNLELLGRKDSLLFYSGNLRSFLEKNDSLR